jgi:hypothetical protein
MVVPVLKKEMPEHPEQTVRRALQEKKINHSTMAVMLPSWGMLGARFRQKFEMKRMGLSMVCHAAQAMCLPEPQV